MAKLALNVRELAALLGVSHETIYASIRTGRIPAARVGKKRVVVPVAVAEQLLQTPVPRELLQK